MIKVARLIWLFSNESDLDARISLSWKSLDFEFQFADDLLGITSIPLTEYCPFPELTRMRPSALERPARNPPPAGACASIGMRF